MKHRLLSSLAVTVVATGTSLAVAHSAEASETTARAWAADSVPVGSPSQVSVPQPGLQLADAASQGTAQTARATASQPRGIARLYRHYQNDRVAATLFVRDLPILTFIGDASGTDPSKTAASEPWHPSFLDDLAAIQAGEVEGVSDAEDDPVQRAAAIAQRLNQLDLSHLDATAITAAWDAAQEAYVLKLADETLAVIDRQTQLADSTNSWEQDVLQATNRLRRLLGSAQPLRLRDLELRPAAQRHRVVPQVAVGPVQARQSGVASWYGPGFHGRRSASGERFNQNALTAAHRTLPFGTQVRVTNLRNGHSVVVRINDRGPFTRGRVIDLSRAAAGALGMLGSGVAPVQLEVLGR